eukprot:m51a1_g6545 putative exocyst complex component 4 (962) ;mRNA; f:68934-73714
MAVTRGRVASALASEVAAIAAEEMNDVLLPVARHLDEVPAMYKREDFAALPIVAQIIQHPPTLQEKDLGKLREVSEMLDQDMATVVDLYWEGFNKSIKSYSTILAQITHAQRTVNDLQVVGASTSHLLSLRTSELAHLWERQLELTHMLNILDKVKWMNESTWVVPLYESEGYYVRAAAVLHKALDSMSELASIKIGAITGIYSTCVEARQRLRETLVEKVCQHVFMRRTDTARKDLLVASTTGRGFSAQPASLDKVPQVIAQGIIDDVADEDVTQPPEVDSKRFVSNCAKALKLLDLNRGATREFQQRIGSEISKIFASAGVARAFNAQCVAVMGNLAVLAEALGRHQEASLMTAAGAWESVQQGIKDALEPVVAPPEGFETVAADLQALGGALIGLQGLGGLKQLEERPTASKALFTFAGTRAAAVEEKALLTAANTDGNPRYITVIFPAVERLDARVAAALGASDAAPAMRPVLRQWAERFVANEYIAYTRQSVLKRMIEILDGPEGFRSPSFVEAAPGQPPVLRAVASVLGVVRQLHDDVASLPRFSEAVSSALEDTLLMFYDRCDDQYCSVVGKGREGSIASLCGRLLHEPVDGVDIREALRADPLWSNPDAPDPPGRADEVEQALSASLKEPQYSVPRSCLVFDTGKLGVLADLGTSLEWFVDQLLLGTVVDAASSDLVALQRQQKASATALSASLTAITGLASSVTSGLRKATVLGFAALLKLPQQMGVQIPGAELLTQAQAVAASAEDEQALSKYKRRIAKLVGKFSALAEACVFALRVEAKLHCVHYAMLCRRCNFTCAEGEDAPDACAVELNKDLIAIEDVCSRKLTQARARFVMDGLAPLVCSLLTWNLGLLLKVNKTGVRKMMKNVFAVQQNLTTAIARREASFDRLRSYYELLLLGDEQEVFAHIDQRRHEGKQLFTADQYRVVLELQKPGKKVSAVVLQSLLQKLSE